MALLAAPLLAWVLASPFVQPVQAQEVAIIPEDSVPRLGEGRLPAPTVTAVPGRVQVQLDPRLWNQEFPVRKGGVGIERLRPTRELARILECYGVERIWRAMPQLEVRSGEEVQVIGYRNWVLARQRRLGVRRSGRRYDPPELPGLDGRFEMQFEHQADLRRVVEGLRAVPGVISARAVVKPQPQAAFFPDDPGWLVDPNDPAYDENLARGRWAFHNPGIALGSDFLEDFDGDLPEAWEHQRGDPAVVVAVLDDGVDVTHPDLYLNVFLNNGEVPAAVVASHAGASTEDGLPQTLTFYDLNVPAVVAALAAQGWSDTNGNGFLDGEDALAWWGDEDDDDDGNGFPDDLVGWDFAEGDNRPFGPYQAGHGTPVAGVIAAVAGNREGVAGVAHGVRILPVTSVVDIAEIAYALSFLEVRVLNQSMANWFTGGSTAEVNTLLNSLEPEGVVYVASLGNEPGFYYGSDPSQREQVISVASFGPQGRFLEGGHGPKTDVVGPGAQVGTLAGGGGTQEFSGTSSAAPFVAGIAALVASQSPTLSGEQIRSLLRGTADDPESVPGSEAQNSLGWDLYSGWGFANAGSAVGALRDGRVFPEANILSLAENFPFPARDDALCVQVDDVPIRGYLGVPGGDPVSWTLRRSSSWDLSNATTLATGTSAYSDGSTVLHTVDTDALDGRQILELEVTTGAGEVSRERGVIDLPRAYLSDFRDGMSIVSDRQVWGFAYGPGYSDHRLLIAPGWSPAPADFVELFAASAEAVPEIPLEPGRGVSKLNLGGELEIFSLPVALPPEGDATLRLEVQGDRLWSDEVRVQIDSIQPPLLEGFPVTAPVQGTPPTAVDLDADGRREILVAGNSQGRGKIRGWRTDGTLQPGWVIDMTDGELIFEAPATGDVDGDGRPEIVIRTFPEDGKESIRVFEHDGTEVLDGWPVTFGMPQLRTQRFLTHPVLADVDLDGRLDILVAMDRDAPAMPSPVVRALAGDGSVIRDFVTEPGQEDIYAPAVGDVDGDGEIEVAAIAHTFGSTDPPARLYVWKHDGTLAWASALSTSGNVPRGLALADVDGDRRLEVLTAQDRLLAVDNDGTVLWEANHNAAIAKLSVAQLHPDTAPNELAVLLAERYSYPTTGNITRLWAFDAGTGMPLTGWEAGVRFADAEPLQQPIVADLRGGPDVEIGCGNDWPTPGFENPDHQMKFSLAEPDGTLVEDGGEWPVHIPGGVNATPLVGDLDGDGTHELVIPGGSLWAFDLAAPAGAGSVPWGEHAHDPRRSSNYHGDLRILSPATATARTVGPHDPPDDQSPLLVRTRFGRGAPAGGEDKERWSVVIGERPAPVSEVKRIQGEHWLLVAPVMQPGPGAYTLRVGFDDGGIPTWDSYPGAVVYESGRAALSLVTVVDRSGSMLAADKIQSARYAGRFFVASAAARDQVGMVSFDTEASDDLGSGLVIADAHRGDLETAVEAIEPVSPAAMTSIGAGLELAMSTVSSGASENRWAIVLLSDGRENYPPLWGSDQSNSSVRGQVSDLQTDHPDFQLHTIALGPDADQELLAEIASFGGGTFYPVYLGNSLSLHNRLADVYQAARDRVDGMQRLLTHGGELGAAKGWSGEFVVPRDSRRLRVGLVWRSPSAHSSAPTLRGALSIAIVRPDGTRVRSSDRGVELVRGSGDRVYTLAAPQAGIWKVRLKNRGADPLETLLAVSADLRLEPWVILMPQADSERPAATLLAGVMDIKGHVRNARFLAQVTRPDKAVKEIELRDDGQSGDGRAGDGIFAARVPWEIPGSYLLRVSGEGDSPVAGAFRIQKTLGYWNRDGTDRDRDGLPDAWERENCRRCGTVLNPKSDPDKDGLDNAGELAWGTHPKKPDSDGDGVSDGKEVAKGTNPAYPDR